jgi:hypothetical protein
VDFDELKRDYLGAAFRLQEIAAAAPFPPEPFRYDPKSFMAELRDLVARGLPVRERAVRKNKAYAASIEYVTKCVAHLYGPALAFSQLDDQLRFVYRRVPRVYHYALQVFWTSFDCASGHTDAEAIALRHLGCISALLKEMGFAALDRFLGDIIEISGRLASSAGIAHRGGG